MAVTSVIISAAVLSGMAAWGQHSASIASEMNNQALDFANAGRLGDAESLFESALAESANDNVTRAKVANNLAWLYQREDRYPEAEQALRHALQWRQKSLPPDSIEVAYSLNNLGDVYRTEGKDWEARNLMDAAVRILNESHPEADGLPSIRSNLAVELCNFHEYDRAEVLLRSALADSERLYGDSSRQTGIAVNNLAQVMRLKKSLPDAQVLYDRAVKIFEALGQPGQKDLAITLANIGELREQQNKCGEARQFEQRALDLLPFDGTGPLRATVLQTLGNMIARSGNPAGALTYFEQSLDIQDKILGNDHPATVRLLLDYAAATRNAGQKSLSRKLKKRANDLLSRLQSTAPQQFTISLNSLRETR
jgi:tetratricopeptide (TPR) repeat protein